MESVYNTRKEQLAGSKNVAVSSIDTEMSRVRGKSPKPLQRLERSTTNEKQDEISKDVKECREVKKVAYKSDLEEIKNKVSSFESVYASFEQTIKQLTEDNKNELLDLFNSKLDENKKQIESLKVESLKNVLNDSIAKMNEQLKRVSEELVNNLDAINELKSRIQTVEDLF